MTLKFASATISGSTEAVFFVSPDQKLKRFPFWGLSGECEITGQPGGRDVIVSHILHNSYSKHSELVNAIYKLESLLSRNGPLEWSTGSGTTLQKLVFNDSTFDRYEPIPMPGQNQPGILQDIARTLFKDDGNADGGWFLPVQMHFRQLVS